MPTQEASTLKNERLNKRAWLEANLSNILREATYHKEHKHQFLSASRLVVWRWGAGQGSCKIPYVE